MTPAKNTPTRGKTPSTVSWVLSSCQGAKSRRGSEQKGAGARRFSGVIIWMILSSRVDDTIMVGLTSYQSGAKRQGFGCLGLVKYGILDHVV